MNKKVSVLFQIDPLNKLNLETDSTISLIKEAMRINLEISICNPENIRFSGKSAITISQRIVNQDLKVGRKEEVEIKEFDFFFIRQDPPINMSYLTNCYLLEMHGKFNKKPYFVNDPSGIKNFTEKIFPLYFVNIIPSTLISSNLNSMYFMMEKFGTVVLKTLYNKGGHDVYKVSKKEDAEKIFKKLTQKFKNQVVVQEFLEEVKLGDKRIIILDGSPVGVVNRIPKKGNFKANLHLGGIAQKTVLTGKERKICDVLRPFLKKNNLFFVGIDVINEKLTEINVTSPTGINQIDDLYKTNLSGLVWKKLLKKI